MLNFSQPLDHLYGKTNVTFQQRMAVFTSAYLNGMNSRPVAANGQINVPVVLYDHGAAPIDDILPTVINSGLGQLWNQIGALGIVLEHRYYGASQPSLSDLNTNTWGPDVLQYLDINQEIEDIVNIIRSTRITGLQNSTMVRYILYGNHTSGSRALFSRYTHPDLVFGAVGSSAPVVATVDLPEYYYAAGLYGDSACVQRLEEAVNAIDDIIAPNAELGSQQPGNNSSGALLSLFGLPTSFSLNDFANLLALPVRSFGEMDATSNSSNSRWNSMCSSLKNASLASTVQSQQLGTLTQLPKLPDSVLALSDYVRTSNLAQNCNLLETNVTVCYDTNAKFLANDKGVLRQDRAWLFQQCTQYGGFLTAAPQANVTSKPPVSSGPRVVSRRLDHEYMSSPCNTVFGQGQQYVMPSPPDVSQINKFGNTSLPGVHMAFVDGQWDPYRVLSVHSNSYFGGGGARVNNTDSPSIIVPGCHGSCEFAANSTIVGTEASFINSWLQKAET